MQSLTGSVSEPDAMFAVSEVSAMLALHQKERWARRHLDGPLGHLSPAITAALEQLPSRAPAIEEARAGRARAFGVAHEAFTTVLARRGQLDATSLLQSAADTSWTDSVVKVWCDDLDERGSGVFIRPDLLVTAAHVISTLATPPDAARVHLEIPSHGSSRLTAIAVSAFDATQDYALLVVPRVSALGVAARFDFDPHDGFEVSRFGYPVDGGPSGGTGHISRIGDLFYTSDLHIPAGASGGGAGGPPPRWGAAGRHRDERRQRRVARRHPRAVELWMNGRAHWAASPRRARR